MKTNSSAKKRLRVTGTGKIKRKKAFKNHILTKKETKRKRALGHYAIIHPSDEGRMKHLLTVGK